MTPRDFSSSDPYSADILQGHSRRQPVSFPEVRPELDLVVEVFGDDFVGGIIGGERTADGDFIRLEDRYGASRLFKLRPGGFLLEGKRITYSLCRSQVDPFAAHAFQVRIATRRRGAGQGGGSVPDLGGGCA